MEQPDQQEHREPQGSESPQECGRATGKGKPEAPQVIGTDAPLIALGPAYQSDWKSHPDRTMVIETSRIHETNDAYNPNFIMVPIETRPPSQDGHGAGNEEGKVTIGEQGKGRKSLAGQEGEAREAPPDSQRDRNDEGNKSGRRHEMERVQPAQSPSLTRVLLYSGIMSLVCGIVGAWGYSYFFGPEKSGDQKSSGKSSGSSKGSESSQGSGSSEVSGSSEGAGASKNSSSNQESSGAGKFARTEAAWLAAVKELQQVRAAEQASRGSEAEKRAILDFLKNSLLSAGHPGGESLAKAFWAGGQGKNVMLHEALDVAESQAAEAFADRPLAEASVREMLGLGYLSLGDAALAVKQYERALALREAMQGANQPETATCRNQLAVAYRLAGRAAEGGRLFDRDLRSPTHAAALAVRGSMLLQQKKPAEAELKLRECLTMRQQVQPDDWTTFDTKSFLGEALLDQKKFANAEPFLLSGYEGIKQRENTIPHQNRSRLTKAIERLIRLYEAWGKEDQAMRWRQEREAIGKAPH
jgi:hypothetical protein